MLKKNQSNSEMLKGTLDMMILRTPIGMGIPSLKVIERTSEDVLEVEQGSLYPALHRLKIVNGFLPTGVRAKTIARRSSIGCRQKAVNSWCARPVAGAK